jgi:DNA-binding MarR family transcriptional regulator
MLQLQNFLPYKISRLDNDLSAGLQRIYSLRFGLNVSQWRILAAAAGLEPTSVTELTDYSGMDKVTVSRSVRELVDREFLTRIPNENDRRRATLTLTEAGRTLYEQIAPDALVYEQELLNVLDPTQLKTLLELLDKLLDQAALLRQTRSRIFPVQQPQAKKGR